MRLIGYVKEEAAAQVFADYLFVQGIKSEIEHEKQDGWGIWITDEDHLQKAAQFFAEFQKNPNDSKYHSERKSAEDLRQREKEDLRDYQRRVKTRTHLFPSLKPFGFGPVTFAMIIASLAVFTWSRFGNANEPIMSLFIADFGNNYVWGQGLPEVRQGEVWRIFTPMFIHFGFLHIIFNVLLLRDLGSMIEDRQGPLYFAILALVMAGLSNLAQYFYTHSPIFGGMSGVVYGLIGYIWIRGRRDPASGLHLNSYTVTSSLIWFFACLVGVIPHVANAAHAGGLAVGMAWGFISSLRHR